MNKTFELREVLQTAIARIADDWHFKLDRLGIQIGNSDFNKTDVEIHWYGRLGDCIETGELLNRLSRPMHAYLDAIERKASRMTYVFDAQTLFQKIEFIIKPNLESDIHLHHGGKGEI